MNINHQLHDTPNEYDAVYLMSSLLDDLLQKIEERKEWLSDVNLLSYIKKKFKYLRDITSHYFFLSHHDILCQIDRRIEEYTKTGISPHLEIGLYTQLIQQFYRICSEESMSYDKNSRFIMFTRNRIKFISEYSHILKVDSDEYGGFSELHVHQATRGDIPEYIIFIPGTDQYVLFADKLHTRIRSAKEEYIDSSLLPLKLKTSSIKGKFRFGGDWYYALNNRKKFAV